MSEFPELDFNPGTTDPLRIIGFLDTAGRHAEIHYDVAGRLERIVDAVGIESIMAYDGDTDEIIGLKVEIEFPRLTIFSKVNSLQASASFRI